MKYFWIQFVLVLGALLLAVIPIRHWDRANTWVWRRIAVALFVIVNVYAVLRPSDVTWLAEHLGVGRGADLVLYVMVLAMGFLTVNTFLRFRSTERKIIDLARTFAINEGLRHNHRRFGPDNLVPAPSHSVKA